VITADKAWSSKQLVTLMSLLALVSPWVPPSCMTLFKGRLITVIVCQNSREYFRRHNFISWRSIGAFFISYRQELHKRHCRCKSHIRILKLMR
jgi:hypothetical protein